MILLRVLVQTVFLAMGQIWANKVRSILTTLGIIIGVGSILSVVAALDGLRQNVLKEFETFGAKKVFIDGTLPRSQWSTGRWREVQLKLFEVEALREHCPSIAKLTPHWYGNHTIASPDKTLQSVQVVGIWPEWHEIENRHVIYGRQFMSIDEDERRNVCLINDKAIVELGLSKDPTSDYIQIAGRRFLIVGVVETKDVGPMFGGGDVMTEVFVPFNTARNLNPNGWLNYAVGELRSTHDVEDVKAEVRFVLRRTRHLGPEDEETFEVEVMQQYIDQFNALAAGITAAAGGIVGISLLVGGIGIMNIMLVSVSERTREIGLRKAIGARPGVILTQFLVEAVVLCLAGAGVGLAAGQGMVLAMRAIPDAPLEGATIPPWAIALAAGFSAATGIIFGMFPALKAARLNPIDALRHE